VKIMLGNAHDRSLSRRRFLKFAAGATAVVGVPFLAACGGGGGQPAPAATSQPAATSAPAGAGATPKPTTAPSSAAPVATATPAAASGAAAAATPAGPAKMVQIVDTKPAKFNEAPMLADLVKAGKLPPVEQRVPEEPLVYKPVDQIGKYGGTWHRAFTGPADSQNMERICHDHFIYWDPTVTKVVPNIAKSWDIEDGGKTFTFHLRKGMKWSDGQPFTADDILFWYEDLYLNDELNPSKANWMAIGGKQGKVVKVDDTTVQFQFAEPYYLFLQLIASLGVAGHMTNGKNAMGLYSPKHYMQQFHPKYTSKDQVDKMAKDAKFNNWVDFFKFKNDPEKNIDCPTTAPWKTTQPLNTPQWVLERNPYYFAVDTEGNQLPYIDKVQLGLAENLEVVNLRAVAGEYDIQVRHIDVQKVPVYKQNQQKGNYTVKFYRWQHGTDAGLFVNQNYTGDDQEIKKWLGNKDFRIALSLGIDRDQLNQTFWLGTGDPGSAAPGPGSPFYLGPESRKLYSTLDPEKANQMLDKLGLDKKDSNGFRLRTDGKGPLTIEIATVGAAFVNWTGISQMVAQHWAKNIGIKAVVNELERSLAQTRLTSGQLQIRVWSNDGSDNPFTYPDHCLAYNTNSDWGPLYGAWWQSGGKQGVKPEGDVLKMLQLYDQAKGVTGDKLTEIGKQILQLYIENMWCIGTVGVSPALMGVAIIKNYMGNVPDDVVGSTPGQSIGNARPEQFFFNK
jgi:peptide/nickel transport system substrate-binding protein